MTDIFGDLGNNLLNGTAGDDIIYTGGGKDTVSAGDGNDTIVINGVVTGGSSFDGGTGTDSLSVSMAAAVAPSVPGDTYYTVGLYGASLTGIERLQFASQAGEQLRTGILSFQVGAVGTLVGGAGADQLQIVVPSAGASTTYVLPAISTENWGSEDTVSIVGLPPQSGQTASNYTLNSSAYAGNVQLIGQGGNDTLDAGTGNDLLVGNDGNDTMNGGAGNDFLITGAGADVIQLSLGNDTVADFTQGSDKVDLSGLGITSLAQLQPFLTQNGNNAVFSLLYNGAVNTLTLNNIQAANLTANDFIFASPTAPLNPDGTPYADTLFGAGGNDTLNGLGGNDIIYTGGGKDSVDGGAGNDTIVLTGVVANGSSFNGGADSDTLALTMAAATAPTAPNDVFSSVGLNGSSLSNIETVRFDSQAGQHLRGTIGMWQLGAIGTITGGAGADQLMIIVPSGLATNYVLPALNFTNWTSEDSVLLFATQGTANYTLDSTSYSGNAVLIGQDGNDTLISGAGNDLLKGGAGNDTLNGGAGNDTIDGGDGQDTVTYANATGGVTVDLSLATAQNTGGAGTDTITNVENVTGSGFDDTLTGTSGDNTILGGDGNDTLNGGAGNDTLNGGAGNDFLITGTGADVIQLSLGNDTVSDFTQGSDKVDLSGLGITSLAQLQSFLTQNGNNAVFSLLYNGAVNTLTLNNIQSANLTANDFIFASPTAPLNPEATPYADTLFGAGGNDTLNGLGGDDIIYTGGGKDSVDAGAGNDTIVLTGVVANGSSFNGGADSDTLALTMAAATAPTAPNDVFSSVGLTAAALSNIETLRFDSMAGEHLRGTMVMAQLGAISTITGGAGADQLLLVVPSGLATNYALPALNFTNWTSEDSVLIYGVPPVVGQAVPNYTFNTTSYGGTAILVGSTGNDTLISGSGNDSLFGDDGNDTLNAGQGNDIIDGGTGTDTVTYADAPSGVTVDLSVSTAQNTGGGGTDTITNVENVTGSAFGDTLTGTSGDNTILGGDGRDTIVTGGGKDTVSGGTGNDVIVLNGVVAAGSSFDGGADADTLALTMAAAVAPTQPTDPFSAVNLISSAVSNIETLRFDSQAGEHLRGTIVFPQLSQVGTVTGGAGADQLLIVVPAGLGTNYVLPALTFTNWTSDDSVLIFGVAPAPGQAVPNYTFNSTSYAGNAILIGQNGNDTLISGTGNDTLTGGAGNDTLNGGAGNDKIDGGDGQDTVVFSGALADYTVVQNGDGSFDIGNATDGTDHVTNVETFRFSDGDYTVSPSSGLVADGYLAHATVWIDMNGNGIQDGNEPTTTTDDNGNFSFNTFLTGPIRASGGTNIDTGELNMLVLSAPGGSSVINPLTTLVQELVSQGGVTAEEAQTQVKAALGLDPTLDLTTVDLIAEAANDPAALEAQKAAAAVAEVLNTVVANFGDPAAAVTELAVQIGNDVSVDLTDPATLTTVLAAGLENTGTTANELSQLVEETQAVTQAIDDATDLGDITDVQGNHAPVAEADFTRVEEDGSVSGNVLTGVTAPANVADNAPDHDPDAGDALSVVAVNGSALGQAVKGLYGTLTIHADGSYTYAADGDILDALKPGQTLTDSFSYGISDGKGGIASSTLSIDVSTISDLVTLNSSGKNATLAGTAADEVINGGTGNDTLSGLGGSDRIYGASGNDALHGGDGWDLLVGGTGNDTLYGDNGNDVLAGGKGNDTLFGGSGADVFEFGNGGGNDVIKDFELGMDHIHLSDGLTVSSMKVADGNTTLTLSDGDTIQLSGITGVADYHTLLTADLPSWTDGWALV